MSITKTRNHILKEVGGNSLIRHLRLALQQPLNPLAMPIATNGINGPGLDTLGQAPVALLITGRPIRIAVGVTPEEPHVVAYDAGPVVFEPAPVVPVQAGLRRDGVGECDVSLFV